MAAAAQAEAVARARVSAGVRETMDFATFQTLSDVLFDDVALLDEQRWEEWLDLYCDDAVIWLPAWDDEHELTADPGNEVSLFYVSGKAELSDRVWRWSQGDSPASVPLPRTSHLVGNIRVLEHQGDQATLSARWHNQVFRKGRTWSYAGSYRHRLRREQGRWRIAEKYIVLTNDLIDTALDLYHV